MKKNEESFKKEVQEVINHEPLLKAAKTSAKVKSGKYIKMLIYSICLAGIGIVFNSCMAGYESSQQPTYMAYERTPQPEGTHVWIEGNWNFNNQTHVYVQRAGYWDKPRQGKRYVEGSWQTTQHGKSWSKGHWQNDNDKKDNHGR